MSGRKAALILASQSAARRRMLADAGLSFDVQPADIDEDAVLAQESAPEDMALHLSAQKALKISKENPDALVIGADQILEFDGRVLSKAKDSEEAKKILQALRGKTHRLISVVSIARGNEILWQNTDEAVLTMRDFDDEYLKSYCACAGAALTRAVGAYELEKHGSWLFSAIEGNHFTILGLPLLPLLGYLQDHHGYTP